MASTPSRRVDFPETIFTEINGLAQQYNALNLGQGKPDFDTPPEIVEALVQAAQSGKYNQYAPGPGSPRLMQAVADHAERFYGLKIDPVKGVIVTAGATEAIFASVLGLVDAGDEVILLEPFFDSYLPNVVMANAIPVCVPLHAPDWTIAFDELRAAFSSKTRALILNTPHNPTGRVFSREELTLIAELCIEHDVMVIADEVYEHLLFDGAQHLPIASLPDMFERTVTISSAGKLFSATGWKVGWVSGPPALIKGVAAAHQFITFAVNYPTQEAVAFALHLPDDYFHNFQAMYERKRSLLLPSLREAGLKYLAPQGTYFVLVDFTAIFSGTPLEFTHHLIKEAGVACIPPDTFYTPEHAHFGQNYVRLAFCKTDEMLVQVGERLRRLHR